MSKPKKLYHQIPIIHLGAQSKDKKKGMEFDKFGFYKFPIYKYKRRTDMDYIFYVNLKSDSCQAGSPSTGD